MLRLCIYTQGRSVLFELGSPLGERNRWNSYAHREALPLSHKQVLEMGSLQLIVGYKFLVVSQSLSSLEHSPHKHRGPKIL